MSLGAGVAAPGPALKGLYGGGVISSMDPRLYSPIGMDLKLVKMGPEHTLKPRCSGYYSYCLGNLLRRILGELFGPASPALGPAL